MSDDKTKSRLIARAAELWVRMLASPKYDNMGDTGTKKERSLMGMASLMAHAIPSNATPGVLERFRESLVRRLREAMDGQEYGAYLGVDYGPDATLAEAAEDAGLKMEWPWKTRMSISKDKVGVSSGYAAEYVNHYPLPDGAWLVTTLAGSDISKVFEYIAGGKPEFRIESADAIQTA